MRLYAQTATIENGFVATPCVVGACDPRNFLVRRRMEFPELRRTVLEQEARFTVTVS
jgi:hypothetical protein